MQIQYIKNPNTVPLGPRGKAKYQNGTVLRGHGIRVAGIGGFYSGWSWRNS